MTNSPLPAPVKSNVRHAVRGITDKIPELRKIVAGLDIDPDLKVYIGTELDELKSNAATIHLHNVERPGGGFDLHLAIVPFHLGQPAGS